MEPWREADVSMTSGGRVRGGYGRGVDRRHKTCRHYLLS